MIHNSPKIIFFGTPQFSVIILQKLIEAYVAPVAVVTAPDKPAGRGHHLSSPPVKVYADTHGILVLQPEKLKSDAFLYTLRNLNADVFVVASYGKMLPPQLLDISPKGVVNVHPSLLPYYRGPSPIQGVILAGDKTTGVTLILTDKDMDHGPILAQRELSRAQSRNYLFPSISNATYQELHIILADLGGKLLVETLPKWIVGSITPRDQDHTKATYTKLFIKEDGHIDWSKPVEEIDRMVRALNPWPGTWSYTIAEVGLPHIRKRVKILAGHATNELSPAPPGTLVKTKSGQLAACTGNYLYAIETVQMEGKTPASGTTFINGPFDSFPPLA